MKTKNIKLLKRIVFVVDVRGWAFDFVAQSVAKKIKNRFEYVDVIYWDDYFSVDKLVKALNSKDPDLVHFFFREHLNLIIKSLDKESKHVKNFCEYAHTTHIPDYLFLSHEDFEYRSSLFSFIDGYFVVCNDLYKKYKSTENVKDPIDVIYDLPEIIDNDNYKYTDPLKPLTIVWSGNSKWGEYAGFVDYKGLQNIIRPAIENISKIFDINFVVLDSAKEKIPRSKVIEIISNADILLIASEKEGTPLTLIEAMSQKCAVVTTDVGIAKEVLPAIQHEFICGRTADDFFQAIFRLCSDRELLNKIQEENFSSYLKYFGNDSFLIDKWVDFLNASFLISNSRGGDDKNIYFHEMDRRMRLNKLLKKIAVLLKKLKLAGIVKKIFPSLVGFYFSKIHGGNSVIEEENKHLYFERVINNCKDNCLVIYTGMWKGVAASTQSLFGERAIKFPYSENDYPEVREHKDIDLFVKLIEKSNLESIIFSGGSLVHFEIARKIRSLNPKLRQYFLWHGSPAQWVDGAQFEHFQIWSNAYSQNIVDGFIVLKNGLDQLLNKLGIKSFYLKNPIPNIENKYINNLQPSIVNVGVFSAANSWYKNPFPQILSLSGRSNFVLNTNINIPSSLNIYVNSINYYEHLPRDKFIDLLSRQNLVLYITNTECSPMIALECWALNIPCIVGPAGDVYSTVSRDLADFLVEPNVDNSEAISERIDKVLENYEKIKKYLSKNAARYNQKCGEKIEKLFLDLNKKD